VQATKSVTIPVRLTAIRYAAHETSLFEFERPDGSALPPAAPGAHIDVHLPNGIVRPYSLVEAGPQMHSYVIGVKRDPKGRGGSVHLHDAVRVGAEIAISEPRNNFALVEAADYSVLIAGGIGITPIWCMAQRLTELGRKFELHYACRDRRDVAFLRTIDTMSQVRLHIDAEAGGKFLDIPAIVAAAPAGAHFYCCGPAPMLDGYEKAIASLDPAHVHLERFAAVEEAARGGNFIVELRQSGREFAIPEGRSILEVLREAGFDLDFSCEQGICGSCRVGVIEGEPDHRDMVLSDEERAENSAMMICCSGSKSPRLVLAL
jgi:ferredoxin-NADP reductase